MGTAILYKVVDWEHLFENNRTRVMKYMQWVPVPNKFDGDGYTELLDHPNGAAHYGVWVAVTLLSSRCRPRGTLLRTPKKPHDVHSISRITRMPENLITEALARLVSVGWLSTETITAEDVDSGTSGACQESDRQVTCCPHPTDDGTERNGTERNGRNTCSSASADDARDGARPHYSPVFLVWWEQYPRKVGKEAAFKAWEKAVKRIHADLGCSTAEAQAKLQAVVEQFAITPKGMGEFCPYPATWLNQGRYDDDPESWKEKQDAKPKRSQLGDGDL